jgi:hypothetical protein
MAGFGEYTDSGMGTLDFQRVAKRIAKEHRPLLTGLLQNESAAPAGNRCSLQSSGWPWHVGQVQHQTKEGGIGTRQSPTRPVSLVAKGSPVQGNLMAEKSKNQPIVGGPTFLAASATIKLPARRQVTVQARWKDFFMAGSLSGY